VVLLNDPPLPPPPVPGVAAERRSGGSIIILFFKKMMTINLRAHLVNVFTDVLFMKDRSFPCRRWDADDDWRPSPLLLHR